MPGTDDEEEKRPADKMIVTMKKWNPTALQDTNVKLIQWWCPLSGEFIWMTEKMLKCVCMSCKEGDCWINVLYTVEWEFESVLEREME